MSALDLQRLQRLSAELEAALQESLDPWAGPLLQQLQQTMARVRAGTLTQPLKQAPGMRHFLESDLPGDERVRTLYHAWCAAVEGLPPP
ncbi:MAG: hypothetical protein RBU45_22275 [Myxococcota bacterium]|jgi:hypothetical protein|nr:hypothetical protein [Myxococcota bacterium]